MAAQQSLTKRQDCKFGSNTDETPFLLTKATNNQLSCVEYTCILTQTALGRIEYCSL